MKSLGKEIKKARIDKGYRQAELCLHAGITTKYLSEIENEHVDPRFSIVQRIAHALQVDLNQLGQEPSAPVESRR